MLPVDRLPGRRYSTPRSRRLEVALVGTAEGAAPIVRQILKGGAGSDVAARITLCRVVDVVTDYATVLGHDALLERWFQPAVGRDLPTIRGQ